ncbi:MAG: FliH/SctL family protein [Desulfuromonadaceae bacterium]|nr:FliH/SctL family protein [Desulfuromonas sp.]MDY0184989.1 FliH/SctL family protein [Desulfuromonadaceae bacterium]
MSKIWRELEADSYVRVSMRNLEELSPEEPGTFVPSAEPVRAAVKENKGAKDDVKGGSPSATAPKTSNTPTPADSVDIAAIEEKAYQNGVAAGRKQEEAKLALVTTALTQAAQKLNTQSESIMQRSAEDMLNMVMAIARRIIQVEISEHKEIIVRIVQQTIHAAVQAEEFHIRVNPEDMQVLNEHKPLFIASLSGLSNIQFISDGSLTRGGCVLESPSGRVDATLETQLDEIFAHLQETMVHSE